MARTKTLTRDTLQSILFLADEHTLSVQNAARLAAEKGCETLPTVKDVGDILLLGNALCELASALLLRSRIHGQAD